MNRDKAVVRILIEQHADVNAAQSDGATALHWAVFRNRVRASSWITRRSKNNVPFEKTRTPTDVFARCGRNTGLAAAGFDDPGTDASEQDCSGSQDPLHRNLRAARHAPGLLGAGGLAAGSRQYAFLFQTFDALP